MVGSARLGRFLRRGESSDGGEGDDYECFNVFLFSFVQGLKGGNVLWGWHGMGHIEIMNYIF